MLYKAKTVHVRTVLPSTLAGPCLMASGPAVASTLTSATSHTLVAARACSLFAGQCELQDLEGGCPHFPELWEIYTSILAFLSQAHPKVACAAAQAIKGIMGLK